MYETFFMEYELNNDKANHMLESSMDKINIRIHELSILQNQGYFTESDNGDIFHEAVSDILESVKKFFKNIMDSIKKLVSDTLAKRKQKKEAEYLQKRLKEFKEKLASDIQLYNGKTVKIMDTKKYMKAYTKYITAYNTEFKALYSKNYNTIEEFEYAARNADAKMDKLANDLNIGNDEIYSIEVAIGQAIIRTEKELEVINQVGELYQKQWIESVKRAQEEAEKQYQKRIKEMDDNLASSLPYKMLKSSTGFVSKCNSLSAKVFKDLMSSTAKATSAIGSKLTEGSKNKE